MYIDAKVDYKKQKLLVYSLSSKIEERELVKPYFYVFVPKNKVSIFSRLVEELDIELVQCDLTPLIYDGTKYNESTNYVVFKCFCKSPTQVPFVAEKILSLSRSFDVRAGAFNLRYDVRNSFDNDVQFLETEPLYFGFDISLLEKLPKVELLIVDTECKDGKPILVSTYRYKLLEDVRQDNIKTYKLPEELDEFVKEWKKSILIAGHNILGYDIPVITKHLFTIDQLKHVFFDTVTILNTYGSSFQIGSARSLSELAELLAKECGITKEELEVEREGRRLLKSENLEDIAKKNRIDVSVTAKIITPLLIFALSVSAFTQIPLTEIEKLPAGLVAEYALLRYCELCGYAPEYRRELVLLTGERVWLKKEKATFSNVVQVDFKMMYPSFVIHFKIDPTLHVGEQNFDRKAGVGVLYAFVKRLMLVRKETKDLKKLNPMYKYVDNAVKAILNALAYGVQGKQSGYAILGNPYCPAKIFYGTRDVQFKTIDFAKQKLKEVFPELDPEPIYSDTDSLFITCKRKPTEEEQKKMLEELNKFSKQFGLEFDLEDVWDEMYIYSKKNYILKKTDKLVVKGSALRNLAKYYLPPCISLQELLKIESKKERLAYVRNAIETADTFELFLVSRQQVWRLVGKDVQSVKREERKRKFFLKVLTPWSEMPRIALKKIRPYMFKIYHTVPLVDLLIRYGGNVELSELGANDIIEVYYLDLSKISLRNVPFDLVITDLESFFAVQIESPQYELLVGSERMTIPTDYTVMKLKTKFVQLQRVKAAIKYKKINIDKEALKTAVYYYVKHKLEEYNLL